jgi:hypothetical protein
MQSTTQHPFHACDNERKPMRFCFFLVATWHAITPRSEYVRTMRLELTQLNLFVAAHDMCNLFIVAHDAGQLRCHSRSMWLAWYEVDFES